MYHVIICVSVWIVSLTNGIVVTPNAVNEYVSVNLTPDSRGLNGIQDNEWKLVQQVGNTLNDWGLVLTLDSSEYGFTSGTTSSLSISMCGYCEPGSDKEQCDIFFAFSIGDQEYFIFATDLDAGLIVLPGDNRGSFIYPKCQSTNSLISGSPVGLIPDNGLNSLNVWTFRDAFAGGDANNYDQLTSTVNGESFPLKFEFINDDNADSFLFKFSSPTFPQGLECEFASSVSADQDFKLYVTSDVQDEGLVIKSFTINEESSADSPSATLYAHTDNYGNYSVSRDGGLTYEQVYYEGSWRNLAEFTISDITSDTILEILVDDNIHTGGFIATIDYNGALYSTTDPLQNSNFELISSTDGQTDNLEYFDKTSTPWNIDDEEIYDGAKWVWNGQNSNNMVFRFDFGNILNECGDITVPTEEPSANPTANPTTSEPTIDPTIDGCDFDIERYLEECYCSNDDIDIAQKSIPIGYNTYNGYKYDGNYNNRNYDGNDRLFINLGLVLSMFLNIILVTYGLCSNKGRNVVKYEKGYVYSDTENQ